MPDVENIPALWLDAFPFPRPDGNKYTRGHALVRGGAVMTGAARLAARAAQRLGAGLVTILAPAAAVPVYATALESIIVRPCDELADWSAEVADPKRPAVLIGPGLGGMPEVQDWVLAVLGTGKPCVLDADALTTFAHDEREMFYTSAHDNCVLTPHEGEFKRLFDGQIDMERPKVERAMAAAKRARAVVLLKGAETVIASPTGEVIVNRNGPATLATAGAGDVLSGMILGLITQGMPAFQAAAAAAWLHGEAASHIGIGLIAEDLIAELPARLQALQG